MLARRVFLSLALLLVVSVQAFVQPSQHRTPTTELAERRWNFNDGQSPWGLKKNAEIWNGRVAQMAFVAVLLQELIQGKGVVQGIQEGDPVNLAMAGLTLTSFVGLTAFLALKGDDDYVKKEMER